MQPTKIEAQSDTNRSIFVCAALGALIMLITQATQGFPSLASTNGNNDNIMRVLEVRDLLGGQGWFDLTQYRLGLGGGTVMHWSRLIDAPIAAIILLGRLAGLTPASAETMAMVAWPMIVLLAALYFLIRAAVHLGGKESILPATILGILAFHFFGLFSPGSMDHHNVQLALSLGALAFTLEATDSPERAKYAGICAALMVAIGMETVPYVAAAGISYALLYLLGGAAAARAAFNFGLAFAATAFVCMIVTVPLSAYFAAHCDSYSVVHFTLATISGLGLAIAASVPRLQGSFGGRVIALAALGIVVAGILLTAFPSCLAGPYASVDPRLVSYWMENVSEARSIDIILKTTPADAPAFFATPLVALAVIFYRIYRNGLQPQYLITGVFLLVALLVGLWQVRGVYFALSFAAAILAGWIAQWRSGINKSSLKLLLAWLLSVNLTWDVAANSIAGMANIQTSERTGWSQEEQDPAADCWDAKSYAPLTTMKPTTVISMGNLGASILLYTDHRAIAAPYHRNVAGNLAVLDILTGDYDKARERINAIGGTVLVMCPGDSESSVLTGVGPDGLNARVLRGEVPDWLIPVPGTEKSALRLYDVVPRAK